MKNGNVEDIFIGYNDIHARKKGKKVFIIVLFIILILVLSGMVGAYFYFTNKTLTKKQIFINSISSTNIKKFLENDIYTEIENRMLNENSETESKITLSTTEESGELSEIDLRNLEFNLINKNDINNSKTYNEIGINYSGNEIFKAKMQTTDEAIGIASDEIVDRYIGIRYDKIKDVFGIDFNKEDLENFKKLGKIDITEEEKNEYIKTYGSKFFENISEDKFVSQDNFVINKNNNSIDVVSYSLKLSQEEFKNNTVDVLTMLRNDETLLGKIVTGNASNSVIESDLDEEETNNISENTITPDIDSSSINLHDQTNSSEEVMVPEEENFNSNMELDISDLENSYPDEEANLQGDSFGTDLTDSQTDNDIMSSSEDNLYNDNSNNTSEEMNLQENTVEYGNGLSNIIASIIFNKKINSTVEELQEEIDNLIEQVKSSEGDGITITVYVSENGTEKISFILPNTDTLDIEFTKKMEDENDNTIQITYLSQNGKEKNSNNEGVLTYSAEDDIADNSGDVSGEKKNGFTLSLNKVSKDAGINFKGTWSIIDKEEINEKIDFEIKTNGAKNSKTISNDIVVGLRTNENETKAVIENKINFELTSEIEDLTNDNCAFLDDLSEQERTDLITAIIQRVMEVYEQKKDSLKVIDSNTGTSIVEQNNFEDVSTAVTKEEAKNALFNRVSIMMGEAQNNNEEFTIKNLENLEIEGYEVSSTVTEEAAIIVVDTYTFRITPNFELLED